MIDTTKINLECKSDMNIIKKDSLHRNRNIEIFMYDNMIGHC
jgi:hypothetical protein